MFCPIMANLTANVSFMVASYFPNNKLATVNLVKFANVKSPS